MAEQMTVFKGTVDDRPGALAKILEFGAKAGLDCAALTAHAGAGGQGVVYVVPKNPQQARDLAALGNLKVEECAGFLVSGADRVGAVAGDLKPLGDAGINGMACAAIAVGDKYHVLVIVDKKDADAAAKALAG